MADSSAYMHLFVAWIAGIFGAFAVGIVAPALAPVTLDGIALGRRKRNWKPLLGLVGVILLELAAGLGSLAQTAAPGAPDPQLWIGLTKALLAISLMTSLGFAIERQVKRVVLRRRRGASPLRPTPPAVEPVRLGVGPRPSARPRLSAREAEEWIAEWMVHLGAQQVEVTPFRRDGGVDVVSLHWVAQVKNRTDLVPVTDVRELHGVATAAGRNAAFFTASTYSRDAIDFARRVHMPLFIFRPAEGRLVAANEVAGSVLRRGLSTPFSLVG